MYNIFSEFIFPRQVIICDDQEYPNYKEQLIECCYEELSQDRLGAHYTNVGGWQSKPKFSINENDKMFFFIKRLEDMIQKSIYNQIGLIEETNFRIERWWINISGNRCYNTAHSHPMCHYSGIFYIKTNPDCGSVNFKQHPNDCLDHFVRDKNFKDKHFYHGSIDYYPHEGRMLLFPANLTHDVAINNSNHDRISIAFDLMFSNSSVSA